MGIVTTAAETAVEGATGGSVLPWVLLGGIVVIAGAALFGYVEGHRAEEAKFNLYKSQQAAAAEKQVAANKSALFVQQQADAAAVAKINQTHAENLNEITQRRDALLAANRSLAQRLYVRTADAGKQPAGVFKTGASGTVDAQAGAAALDQRSSQFFIDEFSAADQLAADYAALQQVILHDREVCNGSVPGVTQAAQ
jgi:hypothetical protein